MQTKLTVVSLKVKSAATEELMVKLDHDKRVANIKASERQAIKDDA